MGVVKRPYGPWSRDMLEGLRQEGTLKVEAFVEWLAEQGLKVDRTLVSHWASGRSHLPADLLPLLAEFTGHPERVFGTYLRRLGCEVVRLPPAPASREELVQLLLEAGALLGRLQRTLIDAMAPESPGGVAITAEERAGLQERTDELIELIVGIRAHLTEREGPTGG